MGVACALSFFVLAYVQMGTKRPLPAAVVEAAASDLPDSPVPETTTTEPSSLPVVTTTTLVSQETFSPAVVTTTPPAPLPIVTTTVEPEPEPVVTTEPPQTEWTVALAKQAGREIFGDRVFRQCVDPHVQAESGWNWLVYNFQGSGAYGLPQALPGSKMAVAGDDWETNPRTQLTWMKLYVDQTYGGACQAWAHFQAVGSY